MSLDKESAAQREARLARMERWSYYGKIGSIRFVLPAIHSLIQHPLARVETRQRAVEAEDALLRLLMSMKVRADQESKK